jgi:hypothetical protein
MVAGFLTEKSRLLPKGVNGLAQNTYADLCTIYNVAELRRVCYILIFHPL